MFFISLVSNNRKVKEVVSNNVLLLASNVYEFNNYEWDEVVFSCFFDCVSCDYFEMSCTPHDLESKKYVLGLKSQQD